MATSLHSVYKKLECRDLHSYIETLQLGTISKLYNHPASCLAIFRELPELAKHFILRLLFVDLPVTQPVVMAWANNQYVGERTETLKILNDLHILQENSTGAVTGFKLNDIFKKNLRVSLVGGGEAWTGSGVMPPDKHAKEIGFLDAYAQERWECILHYMVRSKDGTAGISRDVVDILLAAGLIKNGDSNTAGTSAGTSASSEPFITPAGFQFLLLDISSQIWFFMLQYLDMAESRGMDLVECLTFLFQLNFLTLGRDYSTERMSEKQQRFLQHLREFGLVYQRKRKAQRFYPTRLAINLASNVSKDVKLDSHKQGFIVVETNFRVYAYTSSSLQLSLLALFCKMMYRFPNMTVGNITRKSVRAALKMGITAEQIINFLKSHAHSEMARSTPVIPATVTDQIYLWELERDRFRFAEGVLYSQFVSQGDFELLRDYAKDLSVLVWENPQRRNLVVTRAGHDEVRRFWKRHKQDAN